MGNSKNISTTYTYLLKSPFLTICKRLLSFCWKQVVSMPQIIACWFLGLFFLSFFLSFFLFFSFLSFFFNPLLSLSVFLSILSYFSFKANFFAQSCIQRWKQLASCSYQEFLFCCFHSFFFAAERKKERKKKKRKAK